MNIDKAYYGVTFKNKSVKNESVKATSNDKEIFS